MSMSRAYVQNVHQRRIQDTSVRQQPRKQTHSQIYFYLMSVGFSTPGVVGESTTGYTKQVNFDALIRAAWSDLAGAGVRLSQTDSDWAYSVPQVSIRSAFGNSNEVLPYLWWQRPLFLDAQTSIKGDWINTAAESAGNAVFYSEKLAMYDQQGNEIAPGDKQIIVSESQPYWLKLDLSTTNPVSDQAHNDLLIWAASTNIETSAITIRVFNEATNYAWMSQPVPVRGIAGIDGQVQPIFRFHQPYLLPANVRLRAETNTAVPGGYLNFICERILS